MPSLYYESESWVRHLGLAYNPFAHFEASTDPHLGDYLVNHQAFPTVWGATPALVFAAHGGGKTAMRLYTARQCWTEYRAFPVSYLLPIHGEFHSGVTLEQHLQVITRAVAISIFIALAFRPTLYLGLDPSQRHSLIDAMGDLLPAPVPYYLEILETEGTPTALPSHFNTAYLFAELPEREPLLAFCAALKADSVSNGTGTPLPAREQLTRQLATIFEITHLPTIDLLVDGVDGAPETFGNPLAQADWLAPLIQHAEVWRSHNLLLKAFVPLDARPVLLERFASSLRDFHQTELVWESENLAELLRRRLYAASGGQINSLDAFAGPGLSGVEATVAQHIIPLPREALLFISRILENYAERVGETADSLETEDVDRATVWYEKNKAWVHHPAHALANSAVF